jgi:hypothetical protein
MRFALQNSLHLFALLVLDGLILPAVFLGAESEMSALHASGEMGRESAYGEIREGERREKRRG